MESDVVDATGKHPRRDPHAADKANLKASHGKRPQQDEGTQIKEGVPITAERLQQMARERERKEGRESGASEEEEHVGITAGDELVAGRVPKNRRTRPQKQPESEEELARKELESKHSAEIEKARPLLREGWYVIEYDNQVMLRERGGKKRKVLVGPYDPELEAYLKGMETPEIQRWRESKEGKEATKQEEAKGPASSSLIQYVAAKASSELPVVRNLLAKMSWFQNSFYDLGVLTFFKMAKTEGLLPEDVWAMTLSDDASKGEIQEARVKFVEAFEKGFDKLLVALPGAQEIARLDNELALESGRLIMTKQKLREAEANRDYWAQMFKTAQSCMCAADAKELVSRMMLYGLASANARAQESINAKEAGEETPKHE